MAKVTRRRRVVLDPIRVAHRANVARPFGYTFHLGSVTGAAVGVRKGHRVLRLRATLVARETRRGRLVVRRVAVVAVDRSRRHRRIGLMARLARQADADVGLVAEFSLWQIKGGDGRPTVPFMTGAARPGFRILVVALGALQRPDRDAAMRFVRRVARRA